MPPAASLFEKRLGEKLSDTCFFDEVCKVMISRVFA